MTEARPLIPKISENTSDVGHAVFDQRAHHRIKMSELMLTLGTCADGLNTEEVKAKREYVGLNVIPPPIILPSFLCCILPCMDVMSSMRKYNDCMADCALVKRSGSWIRIEAISIVPGDIVRVTVGERVPADIRIFKVIALFSSIC
jgi:magnesium-transporting ATPase (P-type)